MNLHRLASCCLLFLLLPHGSNGARPWSNKARPVKRSRGKDSSRRTSHCQNATCNVEYERFTSTFTLHSHEEGVHSRAENTSSTVFNTTLSSGDAGEPVKSSAAANTSHLLQNLNTPYNSTEGNATAIAGVDVDAIERQWLGAQKVTVADTQAPVWARKKRESVVKSEGKQLLNNVFNLGLRASHGICRVVNVTGGLASTITGSSFKLIGGALQDVSAGMDIANGATPVKVPVLDKGWVKLTATLKSAGDAIYNVGVAAEDVAKGATQAAEDSLRQFTEGVLENAGEATKYLLRLDDEYKADDYMSEEDERIVDHVVELRPSAVSKAYLGQPHTHASPRKKGGGKGRGFLRPRLPVGQVRWQLRALVKRSLERSGNLPTMGLQTLMACAACGLVGTTAPRRIYRLGMLIVCRFYLKYMEGVYRECVGDRMLADMKFEAISRLQVGKPERARWFNTWVAEIWDPLLMNSLSNYLTRRMNVWLDETLSPDGLSLQVKYFTMGKNPPVIRYVAVQNYTLAALRATQAQAASHAHTHIHTLPADGPAAGAGGGATSIGPGGGLEGVGMLGFGGNAVPVSNVVLDAIKAHGDMEEQYGNVTTKGLFYTEVGVDLKSDQSKLKLKLGLPKSTDEKDRNSWWRGLRPSYSIKVSGISIHAKVIVAMRFQDDAPYLHEVWFSFAERPRLHLSIEAVSGIDVIGLPGVSGYAMEALYQALSPLIQPKHIHWKRPSLEERIAAGLATAEEIVEALGTVAGVGSANDDDDVDMTSLATPHVKLRRFSRLKYLRPGKFVGLVGGIVNGRGRGSDAAVPQVPGSPSVGAQQATTTRKQERSKVVEKGISVFVEGLGQGGLTVPPDDDDSDRLAND